MQPCLPMLSECLNACSCRWQLTVEKVVSMPREKQLGMLRSQPRPKFFRVSKCVGIFVFNFQGILLWFAYLIHSICHSSTGHANEAARQTGRSCSEHR